MDSCNNLGKKRISCGDKDLPKVVSENVDEVEELGDMRNGFCDREINLEMNYTSNERVECSIRGFGCDFDNEGSEDKITTIYDDRENEKILKENREHEEQTSRQRGEDERGEGYVKDRGVGNLNIA
jgi:hypothetical protein